MNWASAVVAPSSLLALASTVHVGGALVRKHRSALRSWLHPVLLPSFLFAVVPWVFPTPRQLAMGLCFQKLEGFEEAAKGRRPRWRRLRRDMRRAGVARGLADEAIGLVRERAMLLRRMAVLGRTKKLFELWHVFHNPLVYVMLGIAAVHISLAIYFGYSIPGR